jgi:hypothetical protein
LANSPGALLADAAVTVLLIAPLLRTCTDAAPLMPEGTWKLICVGEM